MYDDYENRIEQEQKKVNKENNKKPIMLIAILSLILIIAIIMLIFLLKKINAEDNKILLDIKNDIIIITVGESKKIPFVAQNIDVDKIEFKSSNEEIVSINNNTYLYGETEGESIVTAKVIKNKKEYTDEFKVIVEKINPIVSKTVSCELSLKDTGLVEAKISGDAVSYGFSYGGVKNGTLKEKQKSYVDEIHTLFEGRYTSLYNDTESKDYKSYEKIYYENPSSINVSTTANYYVKSENGDIATCSIPIYNTYQCTNYLYKNNWALPVILPTPEKAGTVGCYVDAVPENNYKTIPLLGEGSKIGGSTRGFSGDYSYCHDRRLGSTNWEYCISDGEDISKNMPEDAKKEIGTEIRWLVYNSCHGDYLLPLNYLQGLTVGYSNIKILDLKEYEPCYKATKRVNDVYKETGKVLGYQAGLYVSSVSNEGEFNENVYSFPQNMLHRHVDDCMAGCHFVGVEKPNWDLECDQTLSGIGLYDSNSSPYYYFIDEDDKPHQLTCDEIKRRLEKK